jgi:alginate O-acetyltransferase complex protein AlgI
VMLVVMIGWVFFRAETLPQSLAFLQTMFGLRAATELSPFTVRFFVTNEVALALAAGILGSTPIWKYVGLWQRALAERWRALGFELVTNLALLAVFFASILQVAARTYNPFIYFRF